MKTVVFEQAELSTCIEEAQQERVIITRNGNPVALIVGLDNEQVHLGSSDKFWKMISERRGQKRLGRAELDEQLATAIPGPA